MLKKISVALIVCLIMLAVYPASYAKIIELTDDVTINVEKANISNLIPEGMTDNYNLFITRGEVSDLLFKLYRKLPSDGKLEIIYYFNDRVYTYSADVLYTLGVVSGTNGKFFEPAKEITFEEFACMLNRMAERYGLEGKQVTDFVFADWADVSSWAIKDIQSLYSMGLIDLQENSNINPKGKITREEAISLVWKLYNKLTGADPLLYEEITDEILVELNIVSQDDFNRTDNMTVIEFLEIMSRIDVYSFSSYIEMEDWYDTEEFKKLNYLDNETKALLISLVHSVITYEEISDIKPFNEITEHQALIYITRLLIDNYGCVHLPIDYYPKDIESVYASAYQKNIIDSLSCDNADKPISRKEIYKIVTKALFSLYSNGGYGGTWKERLIGEFYYDGKLHPLKLSDKSALMLTPLDAKSYVKSDLSVTWDFQEKDKTLNKYNYNSFAYIVFDDNTRESIPVWGFIDNKIEGTKILETIIANPHKTADKIVVEYKNIYDEGGFSLTVPLPEISVTVDKNRSLSGSFTTYNNGTSLKQIALENGSFKKDNYYILSGYQHYYENEKFNSVFYNSFKSDKNVNVYKLDGDIIFGDEFLNDIRIKEVSITGNVKTGFVLRTSSESASLKLIK